MNSPRTRKRVLAIASGGGHWVQLLRLRPALAECDVLFATTRRSFQSDLDIGARFTVIPDCNRNEPLRLARAMLRIGWMLLRERPDVVISTGAAPGFIAIWIAHKLRIRTIWVDSVANAEELSLSGRRAGRYASLWLTQWQHLAREDGPHFHGSVL